ncbi:MAG: DUF6252 family protein [Longimicrobiales bacterium]
MRASASTAWLALAAAACTGAPTLDGNIAGVDARIDGTQWYARSVGATNALPGHYEITGLGFGPGDYSLTLVLDHVSGIGTYALGVGPTIVGGNGYLSQSASTWSTTWTGEEGEVVVTALTATRIAGTFDFDADPNVATGAKAVTQGAFDVAVSAGLGPAAGNTGHWIAGDVHGPFIATAATLSYPPGATPTLSLSGSNSGTSLGINLEAVSAIGTFALDTLPPFRSISVVGAPTNPAAQWSSARVGGSGSVTVTSITPQRVQGTFTATVIGFAGGPTGPLVVSGTFDMGLGS